MLHEVLAGPRSTKAQYQRELPPLRDALLDAQFVMRTNRQRSVALRSTAHAPWAVIPADDKATRGSRCCACSATGSNR